ncbi:hypothetical protein V6N11_075199 [Hibiscus sabdariffa]|uniref:Uncharacterized protein n=1 Tax=Hibiscus sabdariffa TaxID=183260 RepID=A0ABR2R656_9ROSI
MLHQKEEATGDAHHSVTRAAFSIVPSASKVCQSIQRLVEIDPPETGAVEELAQRVDEAVNDGAVSLNNSGNKDDVPRSEPESINIDSGAVHLREEELPELLEVSKHVSMLPESLATIRDVQQQHGVQSLVQNVGSSMLEVQSLEEPLEVAVGEQLQQSDAQ